ncbi:MAG: VWA domain-containing protein [Blastocatellales bacterium]
MFTPKLFSKSRSLASLLLALAVSLPATQAQSQQDKQKKPDDTIRLETRLVTTDVIVKDKKGKYVTDLKAEDFNVYENGVAQKVEIFEPPLGGGEATKPKTGDAAIADSGGGQSNIISLVLDRATTDQTNFKQVREGTLKYIRERITGADTVAVFGIANDLQLYQPFTQNKDKLIAAVERASTMSLSNLNLERGQLAQATEQLRAEQQSLSGVSAPSAPTGAGGAAAAAAQGSAAARAMIVNRILQQFTLLRAQLTTQQARPVLAALAAICAAQRGFPGKKTVVLFSQGFITSATLDWQAQSVIDFANRANVAIYIIDSAGLRTSGPQSTSPVPASPLDSVSGLADKEDRIRAVGGENVFDNVRHEGQNRQYDILYRISGDTGGEFIKGTNDLSRGLNRIDDNIRARYTLAWYSTDQNFDGAFRKLKVEARRPDVKVTSRAGYYAHAGEEVVTFSADEKKLLASVAEAEANPTLPLFVELNPFRARGENYLIPISLEVPPGAMKFDRKGDKHNVQFDVLGAIRDEAGKVIARLGSGFNIALTNEQHQRILQNNIFVRQDLELAPGAYNIELIFKDRLSGKVAAKKQKLALPAIDAEFSTSSVVLSRHAEPIKKTPGAAGPVDVFSQEGAQIRPSPSREFRATDNLIIFFEVYNAAINTEMGKPMARVTVRLLKDGKAAAMPQDYVLTETVAQPAPHMIFARFIKLAGLTPGQYTAMIETRDTVTKKLVTHQEPFIVRP